MSFSLRFIVDGGRSARFNMAADLYLMEQCTGKSVVTVRFYSWVPAAITLGRMQCAGEQLDQDTLKRDGVLWVRRPTGGRAVLHWQDLTYSCIFSRSVTELGSSVAATYAVITRCLAEGLLLAGVSSTTQNTASPFIKSGREVKLPCFLAPNRNEIMVDGRKLVGSAQYRSSSAVLQHGSLPLTPAYRRLPFYMPLSSDDRHRQVALLEQKSISVGEISPTLTGHDLIRSSITGFVNVLESPFVESGWSGEEVAAIERLACDDTFTRQWLGDAPFRSTEG